MTTKDAISESVKDLSMALKDLQQTNVGERLAKARKNEAVQSISEAIQIGKEILRGKQGR